MTGSGLTKKKVAASPEPAGIRAPETNLGAMLRTFMAMERWTMRPLAAEIGISASTLHRICMGYAMDAETLLKVINWMVRARK